MNWLMAAALNNPKTFYQAEAALWGGFLHAILSRNISHFVLIV